MVYRHGGVRYLQKKEVIKFIYNLFIMNRINNDFKTKIEKILKKEKDFLNLLLVSDE